jgi:predicted metal-dependent hydrolase
MATKQISLPELGTVTLYKRRGNRSLRLSIGLQGEVRVSLPYWLPYKAGEQFALSKAPWIREHRLRATTTRLQDSDAIGKAHRLVLRQEPRSSRIMTKVINNEVRVQFPADYDTTDTAVQQAAQRASIRALRKEAEQLLPQRLATLAAQHGLTYKSVDVKPLKSRWGSCNSMQEITLNLFLMQLPWELIDYVLLHELTHTKVMQHGVPFWAELESHLPAARQLRKQIGNHQPILTPRGLSVA